jgi:hypothetical protein
LFFHLLHSLCLSEFHFVLGKKLLEEIESDNVILSW